MSYVIRSRHPAFGTMYLGRGKPVMAKASAIRFGSKDSAQERLDFWKGLIERDNLDPKFFGNMEVVPV